MSDFEISRSKSAPWGRTSVRATFGYSDNAAIDVSGSAQVTSTENYFKAIEEGATHCTLHFIFSKSAKQVSPSVLERDVIGAVLRHREPSRIAMLRPDPGATFEVSIGPADLIIHTTHGTSLREVLRVPLNLVEALALETLLPPVATSPVPPAVPALAPPPKLLASP